MALRPWPAYNRSGSRPYVKRFPLASGETFYAGDVVVLDGSGDVAEVSGADPNPILGIAAENAADVVESGYVCVYVANADTVFAMEGSSDPTEANIGEDYGIVESDGVYIVDLTDTSNVRVMVEGVDTNRDLFFVTFISTYRDLG